MGKKLNRDLRKNSTLEIDYIFMVRSRVGPPPADGARLKYNYTSWGEAAREVSPC